MTGAVKMVRCRRLKDCRTERLDRSEFSSVRQLMLSLTGIKERVKEYLGPFRLSCFNYYVLTFKLSI